jgi:hypothetical protein
MKKASKREHDKREMRESGEKKKKKKKEIRSEIRDSKTFST